MTLSLIALLTAVASLTWNVLSTIYGWTTSRPNVKVRIEARAGLQEDGVNAALWLNINVRNNGGEVVGITTIMIWTTYLTQRKLFRKILRAKSGFGIESDQLEHWREGISGPVLPYTLAPHHSKTWRFDISSQELITTEDPWVVEVTPATGKSVLFKMSTITRQFMDKQIAQGAKNSMAEIEDQGQ
jgi:hypothetical protein